MPKKLGTSSKALEARERRATQKQNEKEKKERELEDEYWRDDDKVANKKQQRKDGKEEKKHEQLEKKKEKEKLYEEEVSSVKPVKSSTKAQSNKLTQVQISTARQNIAAQRTALDKKGQEETEDLLQENPNRMTVSGAEARTVEDAISILRVDDDSQGDQDRHPERRMKAVYASYEEKMLPILREENPGLRISQLKQMVFKLFQTAPENPKNQPHGSYNAK